MNEHLEIETRWWASMAPAWLAALYFVYAWVEHRSDPSVLLLAIGALATGVLTTGIVFLPRHKDVISLPAPHDPGPATAAFKYGGAEKTDQQAAADDVCNRDEPSQCFAPDNAGESIENRRLSASAQSWLEKGNAFARAGQYRDALYCFSYVLLADPDNTTALTAKGGCLLKLNRHEDALKAFMQAANLDESSPLAREGMMLMLRRLKVTSEL